MLRPLLFALRFAEWESTRVFCWQMGIQLFDLTLKCWLHRGTERQCLPDPGDWGHVGLSGLRYWPEGLLASLLKQLWYCLCTEQENIYAIRKFRRGSAEGFDVQTLWLPLPQLVLKLTQIISAANDNLEHFWNIKAHFCFTLFKRYTVSTISI